MTCTFPGCVNPLRAKGLCSGHYYQQSRGIDLAPLGIRTTPLMRHHPDRGGSHAMAAEINAAFAAARAELGA